MTNTLITQSPVIWHIYSHIFFILCLFYISASNPLQYICIIIIVFIYLFIIFLLFVTSTPPTLTLTSLTFLQDTAKVQPTSRPLMDSRVLFAMLECSRTACNLWRMQYHREMLCDFLIYDQYALIRRIYLTHNKK